MDCNKDEAARLKDIAEVKMKGKDFVRSKKLLLKALEISPDIENASRMLAVCEVHCSAGNLVNGQTNHYGILQVEASADESLIRKQYRKLALLLHPDKNKCAGAEAGFKLVGEAYDVLSDQASRKVFDAKISIRMRTATNAKRNTAATFDTQNNSFGGRKRRDQQPSSAFSSAQCFRTMCLWCNCKFQCSQDRLYQNVQCQKCMRKFYAFEVSHQKVKPPRSSSGFSSNSTGFQETATQFSNNLGSQTPTPQSSKPAAPTNNGYGSRTKEERLDPHSVKPSSGTNRCKIKVTRSSSGSSSNCTGFQETATPSQSSNNLGSQSSTPQSSKSSAPTNNGYGSRTKEERLDPHSVKPSSGSNWRKIKVTRSRSGFSSNRTGFQETATPSQSSNNLGSQTPTPQSSKPSAPTNNEYEFRTKKESSSGTNRHKVNATYKENLSEDDARPRKRLRKTDSSGWKSSDTSSPEGGILEIISMFERILLAD